MLRFGLTHNRFPVRNAWGLGAHLKLVLAAHAFELRFQVHFTNALNHCFMAIGMAFDDESRVLHCQFV